MTTAVQARTLKTRARLTEAARDVISETGYAAMRVEEVVRRAGVAKGTFFAHFRDKDALMDQLIGERINAIMDDMEQLPPPSSIPALVNALTPLMRFMTCERYVFEIILRHSGAAEKKEVGPIAMTFGRFIEILSPWMKTSHLRQDGSPGMLAEGVQAFMINAMALSFCALHNDTPLEGRLQPYLELWLLPQGKN
ncbi:MAG: TetR family transcriptional regulator [Rhodobacteraceae bacterium]|nr:TetR family transcriptional regulator [Paracoccaceae bacterium]